MVQPDPCLQQNNQPPRTHHRPRSKPKTLLPPRHPIPTVALPVPGRPLSLGLWRRSLSPRIKPASVSVRDRLVLAPSPSARSRPKASTNVAEGNALGPTNRILLALKGQTNPGAPPPPPP